MVKDWWWLVWQKARSWQGYSCCSQSSLILFGVEKKASRRHRQLRCESRMLLQLIIITRFFRFCEYLIWKSPSMHQGLRHLVTFIPGHEWNRFIMLSTRDSRNFLHHIRYELILPKQHGWVTYAFQGQWGCRGADAHSSPQWMQTEAWLMGSQLKNRCPLFGVFTEFRAFTLPQALMNSTWSLLDLCHTAV